MGACQRAPDIPAKGDTEPAAYTRQAANRAPGRERQPAPRLGEVDDDTILEDVR
jgi:hypothetical protein